MTLPGFSECPECEGDGIGLAWPDDPESKGTDMSLESEARWSYATSMVGRCERRWCWRQMTRQCRNLIPVGDRWLSMAVWLCEKHSEEQIERNLRAIGERDA